MLKVKIINLLKFIMVEVDIFDIANGVSLIGTCLGLFSADGERETSITPLGL